MLNSLQHFGFSRRDALRLATSGALGASLSGWMPVLAHAAASAPTPAPKRKSCILLYMDGGPSHLDTFDPKGTESGGEFQAIDTATSGIKISEHLPEIAKQMGKITLLRGMSTAEGAHPRAKHLMHTGYREGVGGLSYPSMGAIASAEIGNPNLPIPNFVAIGRSQGAGFLGARHAPLIVNDPTKGVENLRPLVTAGQFDRRFGLLEQMESAFLKDYQVGSGNDHLTTYQRAVEMIRSKEAQSFDLSKESSETKAKYGSGRFAQGCLLARRLVETGVSFVEVNLGGWDTHQDNFTRVKALSTQIDTPIAALLADLKERGMLDSTLVIWMGDFGRTPKINSRGEKPGRDHYPRAWTSFMAGGGVKGGRVIGKTDEKGGTVVDSPVSAVDFMGGVCQILGIDASKWYQTPIGRPIRIVDKSAKVIPGLI